MDAMNEQLTPGENGSVAWDIDGARLDDLRATYEAVARFVEWLQARDVIVPACWYTHGWVVWRLAALSAWQQVAYRSDAHPREAVEWWLLGVDPLQRQWEQLVAHRGRHVAPDSPQHSAEPVPPLQEFLARLLTAEHRQEDHPWEGQP